MAASDDSFSLRALSSEWIFPWSEAMTTPLPPATADEPAPAGNLPMKTLVAKHGQQSLLSFVYVVV